MTRGQRLRLFLVLGAALAVWLLLLGRGVYLTLWQHKACSVRVQDQQTQFRSIPAQRGIILDRGGRTLACTLENPSLAVRLRPESNATAIAAAVQRAGLCSAEQAAEIRRPGRQGLFYVNRGWIDDEALASLADAYPEIEAVPEMKRYYPAGPAAPDLVGVVGVEGHGLSGAEWRYDSLLAGEPGQLLEFVTGGGFVENAPPARVLVPPSPGGGLVLTLDVRMQRIVRHRLQQAMVRHRAQSGFAIVIDPRTGEILALHEEPTFDPSSLDGVSTDQIKAACLTDAFEPGSTYKLVTLAAGLESGAVSPSDTIFCGNGVRLLGHSRIRDHHPYGVLTVAEVLANSSNIGAGRIAERVGWEGCYRMAQDLGFGQPTGLDLCGESGGYLPHKLSGRWSERSLITTAYGQEISCNGLQIAQAFAAVANDGVLMRPLLVKAELDAAGRVLARHRPEPLRRAMSSETAATLRGLLRQVVEQGTGKAAEIPWLPPAGKTGTAQIIDPATRAYAPDAHVLSFVGFAPWDDPLAVCAVVLHCQGDETASDVAVPVFNVIMKDLAWHLQESRWDAAPPATGESLLVQVPDARGLAPQAARRVLHRAGLVPVLDGQGGRVEQLAPPPYRAVAPGAVVHLFLGGAAERDTVRVPDLCGLSLRCAAGLLAEAGLRVGVHGSGWVMHQEPAPGAAVQRDALCAVWASPERSLARQEALNKDAFACETR